jgi:hypothetical protein
MSKLDKILVIWLALIWITLSLASIAADADIKIVIFNCTMIIASFHVSDFFRDKK